MPRSMTRRVLLGPLLGAALLASAPLGLAGSVDAPELAQAGMSAVGLARLRVPVSEPSDARRELDALLFHPAAGKPQPPAPLWRDVKPHPWRPWKQSTRVSVPSTAREGAAVQAEAPLPVVIVSHGLLNLAESFHALAEHLASRGYAVLVLQHDDDAHADPLKAAIGYRPFDQAAALQALDRLAAQPGWQGKLKLDQVALLGYSMGGYGALLSAGARLDAGGLLYNYTPLAQLHAQPPTAPVQTLRERLAAVVTLAPWGAQSMLGGFKPAGLTGITTPLLAIAGDQDDISGYADGIRSAWLAMTQAPRWLLTFENARHNIAHAAPPTGLPDDFATWQALEEPVWRRDRLVDVNNHFVTAFLDLHLRGRKEAAAYLSLKAERANDGQWPAPPMSPPVLGYAGPPQEGFTHWQGFQRRWALGLKLEQRAARAP